MVQVPGGTFGASFSIDRTEVTTAAYDACVRSGKCTQPDTGDNCNWGKESRASHPINCVDWNQATAYCAAAGKRLPTEQEWEHAASGTDGRLYPWGNEEPSNQACWNRLESMAGTCPVGAFPAGASPYGALDMAGNVWEWTSSNYDANARVIRGGSVFNVVASLLRAAFRYWNDPAYRDIDLGFRCAR